jgi:hypothetical protein
MAVRTRVPEKAAYAVGRAPNGKDPIHMARTAGAGAAKASARYLEARVL